MIRSCKKCNSTNVTVTEVTHSNGSTHLLQTCECGKKYNVPKEHDVLALVPKARALNKKFGSTFYTQLPWLEVRYKVLATQERMCVLCGSREKPLHVDHIKPRSKYPELELDYDNLQILCAQCNRGKGANDDKDFREAK